MELTDLYQKVADFERDISPDVKELSQCRSGCSRCCYVDLSIFKVEADLVREWFSRLSENDKAELQKKWTEPLKESLNFGLLKVPACAFLHNETCTIYEVRPLICRTQGSAFKFKEGNSTFLDICPLNENMIDKLKEKEILNLDLLNLILSQLENLASAGHVRDRESLLNLRQELQEEV